MGFRFVWQKDKKEKRHRKLLEEANSILEDIAETREIIKNPFKMTFFTPNWEKGSSIKEKHSELLGHHLSEGLEALEQQVRKDIKEIAKEIYEGEDE